MENFLLKTRRVAKFASMILILGQTLSSEFSEKACLTINYLLYVASAVVNKLQVLP